MADANSDDPPSTNDHLPAFQKGRVRLPRCGRWTHQTWAQLTVSEYQREMGPNLTPSSRWWQARCQRCHLPSVWRDEQMIYPLARLGSQPHADMPDGVRTLYDEAATVAAVSRRAGAALARATVEKLIKHMDSKPDNANLDIRIERIKPQVSTPLGEMLDVVRVTGNKALHVEDEPGELVTLVLSDEEGPALLELLLDTANKLVDELITRPQTTSTFWRALPEAVRRRLRPNDPDADTPHGSDGGSTS